ncbi:FecR family protein [Thalassospira alkalitolerans]|uniref:FecR family protein n=1 Tax=Thalassospira alkalitolerans TaxID=1293890 RepID=UPI003AA8C146
MSVFTIFAPRCVKWTQHFRLAVVSGFVFLTSATMAQAERSGEMAGVSAAVKGEVLLAQSVGEVGILVESGMPVYLGDRITTSANSGMQILLMDETVFTIGPNSDLAIDEFVYDPITGDGKIVANMARGIVRFVTGKIPLKNPSSMDINLPVGSIGIRGTIGLIRSVSAEEANQIAPGSFKTAATTDDGNGASPLIFMAVNQGPGLSRNDTTSRPGAFAVFDQNGNSQNVTGENFGVFVGSNTVSDPVRFPVSLATFDFSSALVRTASNTQIDGPSSTAGTTQPASKTPISRQQTRQATTQTGSAMASTLDVAMAQVSNTHAGSSQQETASILNNVEESASSSGGGSSSSPFTFDGMRQVTSGSFTTGTINIDGADIDYSFSTTVDFANRTVDLLFSNVKDSSSGLTGSAGFLDGSYSPTSFDYTGSTGNASFSGSDFQYDPNCTALGCSASATFKDAYNVDFELSTTAHPTAQTGSGTLN